MSEREQNRMSPGGWVAIVLILLLTPRIWLCFVPGTFNYRTFLKPYHPTLKKSCAGNIRVIAGAIELYNMDQNVMINDIKSEADLQRLLNHGSLKSIPRCAKFYEDDHPNLSLWLGWGRSVVEVPDCYEGHDLSKDGQISCKLHGKIDD